MVVGVSADTVESHDAWIEKLGIPFTLVSDPERETITAYGVDKDVEYEGKLYHSIARTTFLIAPNGSIERVWEKVKPAGHAEEVLEALRTSAG